MLQAPMPRMVHMLSCESSVARRCLQIDGYSIQWCAVERMNQGCRPIQTDPSKKRDYCKKHYQLPNNCPMRFRSSTFIIIVIQIVIARRADISRLLTNRQRATITIEGVATLVLQHNICHRGCFPVYLQKCTLDYRPSSARREVLQQLGAQRLTMAIRYRIYPHLSQKHGWLSISV